MSMQKPSIMTQFAQPEPVLSKDWKVGLHPYVGVKGTLAVEPQR